MMNKDFSLIIDANKMIRTTDIKGKEYAEVNERVKAFRSVHPLGCIKTEVISLTDGVITMKAEAYDSEGHLLASGHAQEKETSSFINKTSFVENCETSAVGRCLGLCGFGIDTSICSAEEVDNAMRNQLNKTQNVVVTEKVFDIITPGQITTLNKLLEGNEHNRQVILDRFMVTDIKQLTKEQAVSVIGQLRKAINNAKTE